MTAIHAPPEPHLDRERFEALVYVLQEVCRNHCREAREERKCGRAAVYEILNALASVAGSTIAATESATLRAWFDDAVSKSIAHFAAEIRKSKRIVPS